MKIGKSRIAIFSGPGATLANYPTLVTSRKGRRPGDRELEGRYDHLVAQTLYEPVKVKIWKFSAHPLEEESRAVYVEDGKDYYEVELRPEDGPYLLPYMARRADGSVNGAPFEESDLTDPVIGYGGRQFFYPDASGIFAGIDRTIHGRDENGEGNILERQADYDFIRVLPSGGYPQRGEIAGVDYFPYKPRPIAKVPRYKDLAKLTNIIQATLDTGKYAGGVWLQGTPSLEETLYWLSLLIDTNLPIVGTASQRAHGVLGNDGDRNIVDAVAYVVSGQGKGLGAVGVQDECIFAAREFKKGAARPGGYKATGGHGGILGTVGPPVTIWYKPAYKHTSGSEMNLRRISEHVEFLDSAGDSALTRVRIKNSDGSLAEESIPRVYIIKYGAYSQEDETGNPDDEVDIMVRIEKALAEQRGSAESGPKLHGLVLEGLNPFGDGSSAQMAALSIAIFSGLPVVKVGRADPGGLVPLRSNLFIAGSNLDANKARLLLMAAMLKLGRLPRARNPRDPTRAERQVSIAKIAEFQHFFNTH